MKTSANKILSKLTPQEFILLLLTKQATIEDQAERIQLLERQVQELKARLGEFGHGQ